MNHIFRQDQPRTRPDTTCKSIFLQDPPDHEDYHPSPQQDTTQNPSKPKKPVYGKSTSKQETRPVYDPSSQQVTVYSP